MLDLTYLYAHKGTPLRSHGFDEIADEEKIERETVDDGFSSPPSLFPIVVWRCTQACNLKCVHCFSNSGPAPAPQELSTIDGKRLIDDLDRSGVSQIVLAGGEPLLRNDLFDLARYAKSKGIKLILSTNGTLITENVANELKAIGFSYVSVSVADAGKTNDLFRGKAGTFKKTVIGIDHCQKAGVKVVLRVLLTRHNTRNLRDLFNFVQEKNIQTVFFYHLFPAGRGADVATPTPDETHRAIDQILKFTRDLNAGDRYVRIFIAGNICDGAYLYKVLVDEGSPRSRRIHDYLTDDSARFGKAGSEPLCIDWAGNVHPNQFWLEKTLGSIRDEKFIDIIRRNLDKSPSGFANWEKTLKERCAQCRYVALCLSGFQPTMLTNEEIRASHPKCYLNDAEISY